MARTPLVMLPPQRTPASGTGFTALLNPEHIAMAQRMRKASGLTWADWITRAVARFNEESPEEQADLAISAGASQGGRERLSIRIYAADLQLMTEQAQRIGVPVRHVAIAAILLEVFSFRDDAAP